MNSNEKINQKCERIPLKAIAINNYNRINRRYAARDTRKANFEIFTISTRARHEQTYREIHRNKLFSGS